MLYVIVALLGMASAGPSDICKEEHKFQVFNVTKMVVSDGVEVPYIRSDEASITLTRSRYSGNLLSITMVDVDRDGKASVERFYNVNPDDLLLISNWAFRRFGVDYEAVYCGEKKNTTKLYVRMDIYSGDKIAGSYTVEK